MTPIQRQSSLITPGTLWLLILEELSASSWDSLSWWSGTEWRHWQKLLDLCSLLNCTSTWINIRNFSQNLRIFLLLKLKTSVFPVKFIVKAVLNYWTPPQRAEIARPASHDGSWSNDQITIEAHTLSSYHLSSSASLSWQSHSSPHASPSPPFGTSPHSNAPEIYSWKGFNYLNWH